MRRIAPSLFLCSLLAVLLVSAPHARNTPWEDEPPVELKEQPWGGDNQTGGNPDDQPTFTNPKANGKPLWIRLLVSFLLELRGDQTVNTNEVIATEKEQF